MRFPASCQLAWEPEHYDQGRRAAGRLSTVNVADDLARKALLRRGFVLELCVPKTSSTSCDQAIFVDQTTDTSLSSDAVLTEIDRL
jgi:hypothetical protein